MKTSFMEGSFEKQPPLNNGHFWGVPMVVIVQRFDVFKLFKKTLILFNSKNLEKEDIDNGYKSNFDVLACPHSEVCLL
jgi:hypothetical protein